MLAAKAISKIAPRINIPTYLNSDQSADKSENPENNSLGTGVVV